MLYTGVGLWADSLARGAMKGTVDDSLPTRIRPSPSVKGSTEAGQSIGRRLPFIARGARYRAARGAGGDLARPCPRMQMLTVEQVLMGETCNLPGARGRGARQKNWIGS